MSDATPALMEGVSMIGKYRVLAVIPARAGSKGLPGKNVADLGGRPLVDWTIQAALASTYIDDVCVTTNDPKVAARAQLHDIRVLARPDDLASNAALASSVILHALDNSPAADLVVYLQPTSPFRTSVHIDAALEMLVSASGGCVVSVTCVAERPEWMYRPGPDGLLEPVVPLDESRRQDLVRTYLLNGAIYCSRSEDLRIGDGRFASLPMRGLVMDRQDSIDIDDAADLDAARAALSRRESNTED